MSKTFGDINPTELIYSGTEKKDNKISAPSRKVRTKSPDKKADDNAAAYRTVSVEKKTRRTLVVLPPTLYARAKAEADKDGISFNEYVCRALADAVSSEGKTKKSFK